MFSVDLYNGVPLQTFADVLI